VVLAAAFAARKIDEATATELGIDGSKVCA